MMTGQSPTEIKASTSLKFNEGEANMSINQDFNIAGNLTYNFNKNLSSSVCCELVTKNIHRRRNIIKNLGIGFTANYESFRHLMEVEEDFSEYEIN